MRKDLLPYWLQNLVIRGFEDDDDKPKDDSADDQNDDDDNDDDDGADDQKDGKDKDTGGLKSALQKERKERRRLEKEARDLRKFRDDATNKDKSETDQAKDTAAKESAKAQKLAERLQRSAVDNVVIKLASSMKFRDIDDAIQLIDRSLIEVDQDEDDPAEIQIDEASVKEALKTLAKKKPHFIVAEGQEDKSGSKFGGGRKSQTEVDEEEMKRRYPALNRSNFVAPSTT
jgi:hypothetical protein